MRARRARARARQSATRRPASALFVGAAFAFLWFLGSLHARIIRFDPDGFFASVVVLGGASLLALQAAALCLAATRSSRRRRACAATVIIGSSLAALRARKVPKWFGRPGIAGGRRRARASASPRRRPNWTFDRPTFWASSLGFMIWVLVTATYLLRR